MIKIKEPTRMLKIIHDLKPAASRLFVYFVLTKRAYVPFNVTYHEMGSYAGIKNPYLAMRELREKNIVRWIKPGQYTLIVDLADNDGRTNEA